METACSKLMAFFNYNAAHSDDSHYLYAEFPNKFVWDQKARLWQPRKNEAFAIGRLYHCHPFQGERFYLCLLLTVRQGSKSFEDLRTVEGVLHPTFRSACVALGLLQDDREWFHTFDSAIMLQSGHALRSLFAVALIHGCVADPFRLWDRYKNYFCDDLPHQLERFDVPPIENPHLNYGLFLIEQILGEFAKKLSDFDLPSYTHDWMIAVGNPLLNAERTADYENDGPSVEQLNSDQLRCYNIMMDAIQTRPQTAHFFLQGPGGTGKTFLYRTIYRQLRSEGKIVLCVASSGIAAILLPRGLTAHSRFRIPLALDEASTCNIAPRSQLGELLRAVDLIIWDEVPMQHRYCFETVHRLMCDLRGDEEHLFGGVPVIMGGDFAQTLPVVRHGNRSAVVAASLQNSFIWPQLQILRLQQNMRLNVGGDNAAFADWLSCISYEKELIERIELPSYISCESDPALLLNRVFPAAMLKDPNRPDDFFSQRAILTVRNANTSDFNEQILAQMPGDVQTYHSVNEANTDDVASGHEEFPREYLQSISLPGLPPSELRLKVGAPIMLLRNLRPREGLCNGTRLVIVSLSRYLIQARILTGSWAGTVHLIPRILLYSAEGELPFILSRRQFPVRLCFAMTINKAQGQSLETVGIDLRTAVFSHGQLYVALSRVTDVSRLTVLNPPEQGRYVQNVVYSEVLDSLTGS